MFASPYENVFFYFRGPSAKNVEDLSIATQVEDNTTKALVNVLQHAGAEVMSSWLTLLGIAGPMFSGEAAAFFLQGGPAECNAARRHLVVITAGDDAASATWVESTADKGRIDAAILFQNELFIAVEAKVGAALDGGQLVRHASDWGIAAPGASSQGSLPAEWMFTTWSELHTWARSLLDRDGLAARSRFLLEQFADYLEIIGVTSFAGFRPEDFALLAARRQAIETPKVAGDSAGLGDPALATLVKDRVAKLWDAIAPRLTGAERAALGDIHVGSLRANDSRMWAATNWGAAGVNLTFELDPDRLELDLVAWKGLQVGLFERWLQTQDAIDALVRLGESYELVVWRRRAIASAAGNPYWMHNTYEVIECMPMPPPADLLVRLQAHHDNCERGWELMAYHLRRSWPRANVLDAGEQFAEVAASSLSDLVPLLELINRPKMGPLPAAESQHAQYAVGLDDLGFTLSPGSSADPLEWRFVASGPAIMVSSPNGMYPRGMRYYLAVWPGPGAHQATYVACTITKSYASGGRDGHIHLIFHGSDIRDAIGSVNDDLRLWQTSEHYPADFQPPDHAALDDGLVVEALRTASGALSGSWEGLDALARRTYRLPPDQAWAPLGAKVAVSYCAG